MNKSKQVISIIVGIIAIFQISRYLPRIEISLKHVGGNAIPRGFLSGFWFVTILVIAILGVYILKNLLSLIFSYIYGEQSAEESRAMNLLQKVNDILGIFYRMVGVALFGGMGAIGLFLPGLEGRDTVVYIMCGVFLAAALVVLVLSIRSIIRIIRR